MSGASFVLAAAIAGHPAPLSVDEMKVAAKRCGTSLVIPKLSPDTEKAVEAVGGTVYVEISLAPAATAEQRDCFAKHAPAFDMIERWNSAHPRRR